MFFSKTKPDETIKYKPKENSMLTGLAIGMTAYAICGLTNKNEAKVVCKYCSSTIEKHENNCKNCGAGQ